MQEIKIKDIIIAKQFEVSENYRQFINIMKNKNINVVVVEAGNRLSIENDLYFDVLWPDTNRKISKNSINNNALVCKLNYNNFSMLFTGDIEEEAEKILASNYSGTKLLKSMILKVAHHGSKTSSIQTFIEKVQPKIALIGVGKNNTFGHPNDGVIKRLENLRRKNI